MKKSFALLLAMLMILSSVVAVSAAQSKILVYQEDFEEGIGAFTSPDKEGTLSWDVDENGNHYLTLGLNLDRLETIAAYTGTSSRWGMDFLMFPIQCNTQTFKLENDRDYQFRFDGTYFNGTSLEKPTWGGSIIRSLNDALCMWPNGTQGPWKDANTNTYTGNAVAGKAAEWVDCFSLEHWLQNYKFGTTRTDNGDGTFSFSDDAVMNYYHVRTKMTEKLAQIMVDHKFYYGKGSAAGNGQSPSGSFYTFTLGRDDFYGDEAIFDGITDQEEINKIKDSYIYEEDGVTLKEYSLATDCSFLKSAQRLAAFKAFLTENPIAYSIDNFRIVAYSDEYADTVSVIGGGSVSALTNPATNEITVVSSDESKSVKKNDYFGVDYTFIPEEGYQLDKVMYGSTDVTGLVKDGVLTITANSVTSDETMDVTFVPYLPEAPKVVKAAAVTIGDYTTESETYPSATLYLQILAGTDGSTIQKTGAMLREEGNDNSVTLAAKDIYGVDLNQEGYFGIRVFGDAFQSGTSYYFKPFVTFEDSEGQNQTAYDQDEISFTMGSE